MRKNLTFLFDVDGVLADLSQAMLDVINARTGRAYTTNDINDYNFKECFFHPTIDISALIDETLATPGFAYTLRPYDGAVEFIDTMREFADVCFVTVPFGQSQTWSFDRLCWLKRHFNAEPTDVYFVHDKSRIRGDMIVDDHIKHIRAWSHVNPANPALLFTRPYNLNDDVEHRVQSWADITREAHKMVNVGSRVI